MSAKELERSSSSFERLWICTKVSRCALGAASSSRETLTSRMADGATVCKPDARRGSMDEVVVALGAPRLKLLAVALGVGLASSSGSTCEGMTLRQVPDRCLRLGVGVVGRAADNFWVAPCLGFLAVGVGDPWSTPVGESPLRNAWNGVTEPEARGLSKVWLNSD